MTTTAAHAEYRRRARRIRASLANAPARRRVCALQELASCYDRATAARRSSAPAGPAATFAEFVRQHVDGPVLHYSHRVRLLREAYRRGIGRFEANLIIAAVQHHAGERREVEAAVEKPSSWTPVVLAFIATQGAILAGLWCLIR